jgi:hypothetical protein
MSTTKSLSQIDLEEKETTGKDRKRLRDRKAQQEHWKWQKSYIEGLQAQIKRLSILTSSERFDILWTENEELRQQVSGVADFMNEMTVFTVWRSKI